MTGAGLESLAGLPRLQRLSLEDCPLTAEGFEQLFTIRQVQELNIFGYWTTSEERRRLHEALPDCTIRKSW